jgi:hypothetical protein
MQEIVYTFSTTTERDTFITERFPQRRCLDVPGCYRLPDGSHLAVFCGTVTHSKVWGKGTP